jgi:hypothetical protein
MQHAPCHAAPIDGLWVEMRGPLARRAGLHDRLQRLQRQVPIGAYIAGQDDVAYAARSAPDPGHSTAYTAQVPEIATMPVKPGIALRASELTDRLLVEELLDTDSLEE